MQAMAITAIGRAEMRDVEPPRCGPGEVLLAVRHVGLCGSDLNTYAGRNPLVSLPRIPGHEIGGTILERGAGVPDGFGTGRPAIVIPYTTCGACSACRAGRHNACRRNRTLGVQQDGGMAGLLAVRHDRLIPNDTLPAPHLSLVEPLSVGFHAVARGRVAAGETVAVIGGGMIGVGAMLGALARGARVLMVEISAAKRDTLLSLGAETVIDPDGADLAAEIGRLTDGHGPDVTIEAVGLPRTFRDAVDLAAFAGRVVYIGYAKEEVSYDTALFNLKELDILGSRNAVRADFEAVIAFLEANPATGERLISRVFPWAEAPGAFDHWQEHRDTTFKIVIDVAAR